MPITPFAIPLWAELAAAGLGGLQGALFAAAYRERRIDILGVMVIGIGVALGGGLLRDVLLNERPVVVWNGWYLVTAAASALLGMALESVVRRVDGAVNVLDAVVIGTFGAIGTTKALSLGVGVVGAIMIGIIGAIGGSILRDVLLGLPIAFLQVGSLYAVAAGAGTAVLVLLVALGVPIPLAGLLCIVVTAAVRLSAVHFNWTVPEQQAVRWAGRRARRAGHLPQGGTDAAA